jgi:hypothetical protein
MSKNVKSLFIGSGMLAVGLILVFAAKGEKILFFTGDKLGLILAVLGVIELAVTGWMMVSGKDKANRER